MTSSPADPSPRHSPAPSLPPAPKTLPGPTIVRAQAASTTSDGGNAARAVIILGASRTISVRGSRDARVAAIAARQRNRVSRRQMLAAGLSQRTVDGLVRGDRLFRVLRGVYAVGSPAPVPLGDETAALLAVRHDAMLSNDNAARVWGVLGDDATDPRVHVTVPGGWIPRVDGVIGHHSRTLTTADRRVNLQLPLTSPARTLLDVAAVRDAPSVTRMLDEAQIARLVTLRQIESLLDRAGAHPGAALLRRLLADAADGVSESEAERVLHGLIAQTDLQRPQRQVWIAGYRVDCHWPDARLVVEVDGFGVHSRRGRFESDRIRDARLAELGITVLRVTWRQLTREPLAVIARIASAIARGTPTRG